MFKQTSIDDCNVATIPVEVSGVIVETGRIKSPALRQIVTKMANQDNATLASCRHKDWSQQAQCGCVMGCLGG